jgi:hypothetical protein
VLTSNGTTWASSAPGGFGVGQTWQDLTSSRANGTTYTNSTGKPIMVSTSFTPQGGGIIIVDGVSTVYGASVVNNSNGGCVTVVPSGSTYSATNPGLLNWYELR